MDILHACTSYRNPAPLTTSNHVPKTRMHSSRMGGCVCFGGVYLGGCLWLGCVCRGCLPGVCVCPGGCLARGFTPPSCGQTDTSKNITFPQLLLRTVKTKPHEIENILMCLLGEGGERKGHSWDPLMTLVLIGTRCVVYLEHCLFAHRYNIELIDYRAERD